MDRSSSLILAAATGARTRGKAVEAAPGRGCGETWERWERSGAGGLRQSGRPLRGTAGHTSPALVHVCHSSASAREAKWLLGNRANKYAIIFAPKCIHQRQEMLRTQVGTCAPSEVTIWLRASPGTERDGSNVEVCYL